MPSCPPSVRISANRKATSVIGRCRPVKTLASEMGLGSGRVTEERVTDAMRSSTAGASTRTSAAGRVGAWVDMAPQ